MIGLLSLFIELLFDQIISYKTYIIPLFTLVSILFIKRDNKYYLYLFLLGFIYDLFFTETLFLHSIIFILLGLIIRKNNILSLVLMITLYNIFIYLSYILLNKINISFEELLYIIKHYYIINIMYYYILRIIYKKKS